MRSALRGWERRQRALAVLASRAGSIGTNFTCARVLGDGLQPFEDLLGVGLLADGLEFFGKLRGITEDGNDGSIKISWVPGLLELLEVLELLH